MFRKRRNKYSEEILPANPAPKNKDGVVLYGDAAMSPSDYWKSKEEKEAMTSPWGGRH